VDQQLEHQKEGQLFKMENPMKMSDIKLAKRIIAKYEIHKCKATKQAEAWMKWFNEVMERLSRWDFYYEFADWYVPLSYFFIASLFILFREELPDCLPVECKCEVQCVKPKDIPFYKEITRLKDSGEMKKHLKSSR
jgi:hypothetical protein